MAEVQGVCDKRFGAVREALAASLDRDDVGASAAVYLDGEPVVDLWGGYADPLGDDRALEILIAASEGVGLLTRPLLDGDGVGGRADPARRAQRGADPGHLSDAVVGAVAG